MECKRSSSPESAAIIGGDNDLLMEIFLFLPVKCLIRLQSVSKHWRYLILDPGFSYAAAAAAAATISTANLNPHSFSVTPHHGLLFVIQSTKSYFHSISDFSAKNSCNLVMGFYCSSAEILIVAPKTTAFAILPQEKYRILPLIEGQMRGFLGLGILFDPSKSTYYKVFSFRTNDLYSEWVEVYGSETHTWKQRVKVPRISMKIHYCCSMCLAR